MDQGQTDRHYEHPERRAVPPERSFPYPRRHRTAPARSFGRLTSPVALLSDSSVAVGQEGKKMKQKIIIKYRDTVDGYVPLRKTSRRKNTSGDGNCFDFPHSGLDS